MTSAKKIQSALKRKTVFRDTFGGNTIHKIKNCEVTELENHWYHFTIDGSEFDCKWDGWQSRKKNKNSYYKFYFRNNKSLERSHYTYEYGVDADDVIYASSFNFGYGTDLIPTFWVLGEVITSKSSYEWYKED